MILYFLGLLLSFLAGVWFVVSPPKNRTWVNLFLSAGGAFLMTIIFTHILPEVFEEVPKYAGIALLVGFLIQIVLENFSKGIEHGHSHAGTSKKALLLSFFALCIHAFIEGMPMVSVFYDNGLGIAKELMIGIMLHKIPVAITLALLLTKSGVKKSESFLYLSFFILCSPLGSALQYAIGSALDVSYLFLSLALTIGILLHVSTTILFESSDHHKLSPIRVLVIAIGVCIGFLI